MIFNFKKDQDTTVTQMTYYKNYHSNSTCLLILKCQAFATKSFGEKMTQPIINLSMLVESTAFKKKSMLAD